MDNSVNVETIASVRLSRKRPTLQPKEKPVLGFSSSDEEKILFHKPWWLGN